MSAPSWSSPLVEVEVAVRARAKALQVDPATEVGRARLHELVVEEVRRWSDDFKMGRRPYGLGDPDRVVARAWRNIAGYGPLAPLLADPDVWEIMVNAPDQIFVKRHRGQSGYHDEVFHDDEHVHQTLTRLLEDAASSHRVLDASEGLQDAQLDDGSRIHVVHDDIGRDGHLLVNIRRFSGASRRTLEELVRGGMLDAPAAAFLRAAVQARASAIFAGAPGTGKTTLLTCCAAELDPSLRVVVAEEVFETDIALPNVAHMQTRPARPERPEVDLRRLVSGFLRMAPDVAVVGEVRDREGLPLLLTLSSGVTGYTTIHAGSARQALVRLRFICQLADAGANLPVAALNVLVAGCIDLVVHCHRHDGQPRVAEIIAVEDQHSGPDGGGFTVTDVFSRERPASALRWTGLVPARLSRRFEEVGVDLMAVLSS